MSILEQLGSYVSRGVRGKANPRLRLHIADTIAAWIAGALAPEGRALAAYAAQAKSHSEGALERLMLNCAQTRLSEVDDIHLSSGTTCGSVVIPAALTLAEGASAQALAEAIIAGYEAMIRLGGAFNGPTILYRGIWPTYFTAPFGVAAVASRLLELDERQAAHALGLALAFASPGVGHQGGPRMGRWLALGQAARQGAAAALAARGGFTADLGLLERDFYSSVYAITPDLKLLTEGLGDSSALEGVSFKPWCAARQTIAATQALKEMVQGGVAPEQIRTVTAYVPPSYLRMVNHGVVSGDRSSYLTSAPHQMALGLFAPDTQFSVAPSGEVPKPIAAFMEKVKVEADPALAQYFPRTWPARVVVETASGREEKLMLHVPGDPERPFGEREIKEKFRSVAAPLIGEQRAASLCDASLAVQDSGGAVRLVEQIGALCSA